MDNYYTIVFLLMITALVGVFMMGSGITGMSISTADLGIQPLCLNDTDCGQGYVCCNFYAKDSGVCDKADMCAKISGMTMNTITQNGIIKAPPSPTTNIIEFAAGLLIIIVSLLLTYKYIGLEEKKNTAQ